MSMLRMIRKFSTGGLPVKVSPEVAQAIHEKRPVVSLESTIITHGFPFPANLEMARETETKIRANGCIPATCAFIEGVPYVGLSDSQTSFLAELSMANKVSRRDIGATMAQRLNGGTTIAGTMIISHIAGIDTFATGGLGGVHREGHITMDVSADLTELSRTPVTVVCAGPKRILDIGRTMEYLETHGVFVGTYNDDGRSHVELPGFYCRSSGVKSPYMFSSWREIAAIVYNQNTVMGLQSGNLVCVPPPKDSSLDSKFIDDIIDEANKEVISQGVSGKEITPFLLKKIAEATNGKSVECNKQLVINNAVAACYFAKELSELKKGGGRKGGDNQAEKVTFSPSTDLKQVMKSKSKQHQNQNQNQNQKNNTTAPESGCCENTQFSSRTETLFIGSVALDTVCYISSEPVMADSNPGKMATSLGGVGLNLSIAHGYGIKSQGLRSSSRFISAVGDDLTGATISKTLAKSGHDTSGIFVSKDQTSARYTAILNPDGGLVVACADMQIFESNEIVPHIASEIKRAHPNFVVVDCNLSAKALEAVFAAASSLPIKPTVIIEPTSAPKSTRLSQVNSKYLPLIPNNIVSLVTPTVAELEQLYFSFSKQEFFDDFDSWFPVLDSLGIDSVFREQLTVFATKHTGLKELSNHGTFQQTFQLLPYIPNILVKLGKHGCVLVKLSTNVNDYRSVPTTSQYSPTARLISRGQAHEEGKNFGIVIEYFDIPHENKEIDIVNVTGAGDSFLGYLTSSLNRENWLGFEIESLEQEWGKWEGIYKSQVASGKTLQSQLAISEQIT